MNIIQMAGQFYDARDTLKRLWGDQYAAKIAVPTQELKAAAEKRGTGILDEALVAIRHYVDRNEGGTVLIILAAALEILEPSGTSPTTLREKADLT